MAATEFPAPLSDFRSETAAEGQFIEPLEDFTDSDVSGGPGPGPGSSSRRPVVIMCGD